MAKYKKTLCLVGTNEDFEPRNYQEVVSCGEAGKWIEAMKEELASINGNETWELIFLKIEKLLDQNVCLKSRSVGKRRDTRLFGWRQKSKSRKEMTDIF